MPPHSNENVNLAPSTLTNNLKLISWYSFWSDFRVFVFQMLLGTTLRSTVNAQFCITAGTHVLAQTLCLGLETTYSLQDTPGLRRRCMTSGSRSLATALQEDRCRNA